MWILIYSFSGTYYVWVACGEAREKNHIFNVSPQSGSLFSASFQIVCLAVRAWLNTQKYGLFCSLVITWAYTERPDDRPSAPQAHQCKITQSTTSSPGRFSLAPHLQSQGKAPWGRGCSINRCGNPNATEENRMAAWTFREKEATTKSCPFRRYFWCSDSRR